MQQRWMAPALLLGVLMVVVLIVQNPEYSCDIRLVEDHEHPGLLDAFITLPDDFMELEDGAHRCAIIFKAVNDQLGVCLIAGELSICEADMYDAAENTLLQFIRIKP
jgi:hypothetical protein